MSTDGTVDEHVVPYKTSEMLAQEAQVEERLFSLDLVNFVGVTRVLEPDEEGRSYIKVIVGSLPQYAHLVALQVDAALKTLDWEGTHFNVFVVSGRPRPQG